MKLVLPALALLSGFALPLIAADEVKPAPPTVSPAAKPFLGVNVDENSAGFDPSQGLPITVVIPGSTAATLGMQAGDHLLSFNGTALHSQPDLVRALGGVRVGDAITVEIMRKNGDKNEKKTLSGPIQERPQVRTLNRDLAQLRDEVLQIRTQADEKKKKEISLADLLQQLKEIEQNLPAAAAEFKKQYPKGEFNVSIKIEISSDKTAKQSVEIGNQPSADLKTSDPQPKDPPPGKPAAKPAPPAP